MARAQTRKKKKPPTVEPKRRSLSDEENERLRQAADEIMRTRFGGNRSKLAKELGVHQGTVSAFLEGNRGAGPRLFRAIERLIASSTLSSALRRGMEEPYPTRRVVIELGRGAGVNEHALLALLAVDPPSVGDPGEDFWQAKLIDCERRRRALASELGEPLAGATTSKK